VSYKLYSLYTNCETLLCFIFSEYFLSLGGQKKEGVKNGAEKREKLRESFFAISVMGVVAGFS
jgi:hypothetical protein